MKLNYTIPFFIPQLGCKFDCIFCSQKKISGAEKSTVPGDIGPEIRKYLLTIPKDRPTHVEVAFFGGSFTGVDQKIQLALLKQVQPFIKSGMVSAIRVSTRPDMVEQKNLDMLKANNVKIIELGIQSSNDQVLKKAKRGHSSYDARKASELILQNGFTLGHQMMVGLPGSDPAKEIKTARTIISQKASQVRIYPVLVIKGTALETLWKKGKFHVLSESEAVKRCSRLISLFENNNVQVVRCGLHPSPGILSKEDLLAGPFHEAFRQIAESFLFGKLFRKIFKRYDARTIQKICYHPSDTAYAVGYGRVNRLFCEKTMRRNNILKPCAGTPEKHITINFVNGDSIQCSKNNRCI